MLFLMKIVKFSTSIIGVLVKIKKQSVMEHVQDRTQGGWLDFFCSE